MATLTHASSIAAALTALTAVAGLAAAAPVDDFLPEGTDPTGRILLRRSPCPGPDCPELAPQAQGLRTVYLAFDGVTLTRSNNNDSATATTASSDGVSLLVDSATEVIAPFNPNELYDDEGLSRNEIIARVIDDLYAIHAPYNVEFVTERPAMGPYSMVVFGGTCGSVAGESGCAGIALLDCNDYLPSNITFVFPPNQRIADLATTAAQEAAHAFGLGHTSDPDDVMYPEIMFDVPRIFGEGSVPDKSSCPYDDPIPYQDSDQMMLDTVGPRGQDTTGPNVQITAPVDASTVSAGAEVTVSATDASGIDRLELQVDSDTVATDTSAPYAFDLPDDLAAGTHTITVRAYDSADNTNFDRITVYVMGGDETECSEDSDCADGEECNGTLCIPDNGLGGDLGDACTTNEECQSGACGTLDGEQRCTYSCATDDQCPTGFECLNACWPSSGDGDDDDEGSESLLCTASSGRGTNNGGGFGSALTSLALIALALWLGARRST